MIELTKVQIKKVEVLSIAKARVTFTSLEWSGQELSIIIDRSVAQKFGARLGETTSIWGELEEEED